MGGYKRFLHTGASIHRSTAYRRRLRALRAERERDAERLRIQQAAARAQTNVDKSEHVPVEIDNSEAAAKAHAERSNPGDTTSRPSMDSDGSTVMANGIQTPSPEDRNPSSIFLSSAPAKEETRNYIYVDEFRETLCPCTDVTSNDIVLMCIALGMRHKLTWVAQLDILKMVHSIFPNKKDIPFTKHSLFKRVNAEKVDVSHHVFCPQCEIYIKQKEDSTKQELCEYCKSVLDVSKAANYFGSLSIKNQLRDLFEGPEDMGSVMLKYRMSSLQKSSNSLEDIFDGTEYQRHCGPGGVLSYPANFSYNFFTDGVPMGNSNKTLWPIYLTINELPEKVRGKYVLLAGIYIGPRDPNLNLFLKPFVDEANSLSTEGFMWCHNGENMLSKAIPMCAIVDSVARCKLLNMQTFHSWWGCTFCYHKQERTTSRLKYTIDCDKEIQDRTIDTMKCDLIQAFEKRNERKEEDRHFRGVKGPSCLSDLKYFDLTRGVVVDYMHCILLGVIRSHMDLLLDAAFKNKCWLFEPDAVEDITASIDARLLKIKPPNSITRPPQSITKRKNWKASEWRSWLIFYCVVCLHGFLKEKYLLHVAMLSTATNILLQKKITVEKIHEAHKLLVSYQFMYQKYFGKEHMVYNVHLLTHISKGVMRFGPVWTHNSFLYEGQNRHLLQLCKSPFSVVKQICRRYLVNKSFPDLCANLACGDMALDFCEDVLERHLKRFVYSSECVLLGKGTETALSEEECNALSNFMDKQHFRKAALTFKRMLVNGFRVSTLGEVNNTRNIDCYVFTKNEDLLQIKKIVMLPNGKVAVMVQAVKVESELLIKHEQVNVSHVKKIESYENLFFITPKQIVYQCIYMNFGFAQFVCKMPYGCYRD